jgi:hypothetical protein
MQHEVGARQHRRQKRLRALISRLRVGTFEAQSEPPVRKAFIRRASWPAPKIASAASGVPKVGAPDCIDSVETKVPNTTGAPGRVSWQNAVPASTSAST